ncbi:hypothetical protein [Vreelandella venusta]|uniref:hypothetical protein n=1 Tax=Vreelandella venusta TaxID=44935 RepID=UPI0018DAB071|nr:hypothetical protein [Halomonas venusta]QPI65953.1 hypothetical protein IR195_09755 [Halomonas venusta]
MKKLTESQAKWFEIRRRGEAKKIGRKRKSDDRERPGIFTPVHAPEVFSIRTQKERSKVVSFISKVRAACLDGCNVKIDFSHTKRLGSDATVLLHAEIHRIVHCLDDIELRAIPPRNWMAAQAMKKIGLFRLTKTPLKFSKEANHKHVANWHSAYGEEVNGEKSEGLLSAYEGVIAEVLTGDLYTKITEAMINVHHHAYIEDRNDGLSYKDDRKPWWLFSQELDGYLTVAFCDLGIGIPRSLPIKKPKLWKKIATMGSAGSDSNAISEAIKDSQTRTGEEHRGKGLKQIVDTVRSFDTGIVKVHSNKGCYTSEMGRVIHSDFEESIMGTVISWRIPLPAERSEEEFS